MTASPFHGQLPQALRHWSRRDPTLARAARMRALRKLPIRRGSGFASLVTALLHQQVSVAAGRSITRKLLAACGGRITPAALVKLSPTQLRACGISRQKQSYLLDLAERTLRGDVDFRRFARMRDDEVIASLTQVRGIGSWTAKMFLLFHMHRPDVVAPEDLGLRMAAADLYGVPMGRAARLLERRSVDWSPYGSLASLVLWAHKDARKR